MRLIAIVETTDPALLKWNNQLDKLAITPPPQHDSDDDATRMKQWNDQKKAYSFLKKAEQFHTTTFNGRRWPNLEKALLNGWGDNPLILGYMNALTEEWPEGHDALVNDLSPMYGANQKTLEYLMKKNTRVPALADYYRYRLAGPAVRKHLLERMRRFEQDLQTELAKPKPKPPAQPADPSGLDDKDEFFARGMNITAKQLQNRIDSIKRTLALSDDQLEELVLDTRPSGAATREALGLPWAPANMRQYVNQYIRPVSNK